MVRRHGEDVAERKDIGTIIRDSTAIEEALQAAFLDAVEDHRRAGLPMVFDEDGQVICLSAEEVLAALAVPAESSANNRERGSRCH